MYEISPERRLILASTSPRRREMLRSIGLQCEVAASAIDESPLDQETPKEMVMRLAQAKAREVSVQRTDAWVIGADTTVAKDGVILGKPATTDEAYEFLTFLQGSWHQVWGGFALLNEAKGVSEVHASVSRVFIRPLTQEWIEAYVATGEPLDKAGGYAVQGFAASVIEMIEGCYANVVGLDLPALIATLSAHEVIRLPRRV